MERTRSTLDNLNVLALMANAPLMANALLTANALAAGTPGQEMDAQTHPAPEAPEGERDEPKRGLLDRIDHWFWTLEQRALEARLADATDIYDLELRIREIERGAPWWSH
jgi:hypothetical protein